MFIANLCAVKQVKMYKQQNFLRHFLFLFFFSLLSFQAFCGVIKGTIVDKKTREPLFGATIQVAGTAFGTVADREGRYTLNVDTGTYTLIVKFVGYQDLIREGVKVAENQEIHFELEPDTETLDEVKVTARKNLENERVLQVERQNATIAIENMGAKEMSLKGISNVEEGVKKITGISVANAGQLIVRGLGDRYSTTTLNGLPIASPNPDNKLIPLDLFPSATVKNITVSKVYAVQSFADYSGAHIDIGTKVHTGEDFFSVGMNVGGVFNTLGKDFYYSDREGSLLKTGNIDSKYLDMPYSSFEEKVKEKDIFGTSFVIEKKTALPDFSGNVGWGKRFGKLNVLLSMGAGNEKQILKDAFVKQFTAQGRVLNMFRYNSYITKFKIAALAGLSYTFRHSDYLNYSLFYARNAIDEFMERDGFDSEGVTLRGSNSVYHAYSLLNNQLSGHHEWGERWELNWAGSYGMTGSDEPDRRQVMFRKNEETGKLSLFLLNQQETMRYFGELDENEMVGDVKVAYWFGEKNRLHFGATYKRKTRDFRCASFYYNLDNLPSPEIFNIYDTDSYLNFENVANGNILIKRSYQPRNRYKAESKAYAAFAEVDFFPFPTLLINIGVRYEQVNQSVDYFDDGSIKRKSELKNGDIFPALNIKYTIGERNSLRFAVSRTVTRPAFVEMAPFLYRESYGSAAIRGNAAIQNGYNINVDLRYDLFSKKNNDMFSATLYFKQLNDPIERVQEAEGGSAVHTFRNSKNGIAMGVEVEMRKEVFKNFRLGLNGSYMYTDVKLPKDGGIYTDNQRALQGASPYLINADISYAPYLRGGDDRMILALVYNVQGPRIHSVGIFGLGDNKQLTLHTLDWVGSYSLGRHWSFKLTVKDLLNSKVRFRQDVPQINDKLEVEAFRPGTNAEIGFTYKF